MLRTICNYFRQCACNHDFETLATVKVTDEVGSTSYHRTYRCKKCGFVQRVKL
jgi:hypothetical protein